MAVKKIQVELVFEDGRFQARMKEAAKEVVVFEQKIESASKSVSAAQDRMKGFGTYIRDLTLTIGLAREALNNIRIATLGWAEAILRSNADIERMTFLLKGLSRESTEAQRALEARTTVNTIFDLAKRAPFEVSAITDSFVKLKSAGLDPMKGTLQGLLDSVAAFGGGSEILHRASIAIQQMAGKGVISMEELRQQLGEAVPRAMELMARGMNMTVMELSKVIATGAVEAKSALNILSNEFALTFGGKAQAMMTSFYGKLSVVQTNLKLLAKEFGDGGFQEAAKNALDQINAALDTEYVKNFARDMGAALASVIPHLVSFGHWLVENKDAILLWGKALATILAANSARRLAMGITDMASAMLNAARTMRDRAVPAMFSFQETMRSMSAVAAGTAMPINGFSRAVADMSPRLGAAAIGARALGTAILSIGGVVFQAVAVITTIISFLDLLKTKSDRTGESLSNTFAIFNEQTLAEEKKQLEEDRKALQNEIDSYQRGGGATFLSLIKGALGDAEAVKQAREQAMEEISRKQDELARKQEEIAQKEAANLKSGMSVWVSNQLDAINAVIQESGARYDQRASELAQQLALKEITEEQYQIEALEARRKKVQDDLSFLRSELRKAESEVNTAGDDEVKMQRNRALVQRLLSQIADAMNLAKAIEEAQNLDPLASSDKKSPLERQADRMRRTLAGLNGKLRETGAEYERTKQMIEDGAFGEITDDQARSLLDLAKKIDSAREAQQNFTKSQKDGERAATNLTKQYQDVARRAEELKRRLADASYVGKSSQVLAFEKTVFGQLAGLNEAEYGPLFERARQVVREFEQNVLREQLITGREQTRQIRMNLAETTEGKRRYFEEEVQRIRDQYNLEVLTGQERVEAERIVQEQIAALREQFDRQNETAVDRLLRQWRDTTRQMQDATAGWLQDAANQLTQFITKGKFDFDDFANAIIEDLIRIQMQAAMADIIGGMGGGGILGSLGSMVGGLFSGGGGAGVMSESATGVFMTAHTGGVLGKDTLTTKRVSPAVFNGAPKFHSGGVIGGSRLRSDEMPIIARKGETVFTEGQLAALRGAMTTQMPNIEINVINESGHEVNAKQGGSSFDGRQMVLDVVLEAASKPGAFRDGMRQAVR